MIKKFRRAKKQAKQLMAGFRGEKQRMGTKKIYESQEDYPVMQQIKVKSDDKKYAKSHGRGAAVRNFVKNLFSRRRKEQGRDTGRGK